MVVIQGPAGNSFSFPGERNKAHPSKKFMRENGSTCHDNVIHKIYF